MSKKTGDIMIPNGAELTTLINTFSVFMAEKLSDDMLVLAAAIYTQIGDTLATIAVVREREKQKIL